MFPNILLTLALLNFIIHVTSSSQSFSHLVDRDKLLLYSPNVLHLSRMEIYRKIFSKDYSFAYEQSILLTNSILSGQAKKVIQVYNYVIINEKTVESTLKVPFEFKPN